MIGSEGNNRCSKEVAAATEAKQVSDVVYVGKDGGPDGGADVAAALWRGLQNGNTNLAHSCASHRNWVMKPLRPFRDQPTPQRVRVIGTRDSLTSGIRA